VTRARLNLLACGRILAGLNGAKQSTSPPIPAIIETMSVREIPCKAFTIVELIVVSAIVGTLLLIIFPALSILRDRDNTVKCLSNVRQIGIAFNDHDGQVGYLPRPAGTSQSNGASIQFQLGPYTYIFGGDGKSMYMPLFHCPSDRSNLPGSGGTSYGINVRGMNGSDGHGGTVVDNDSYATMAQISSGPGTSNFVLAGDIGQAGVYDWITPVGVAGSSEGSYNGFFGRHLPDTSTATGPGANIPDAPLFSSFHTNGAVNLALADGHAVTANLKAPINDACILSVGNKSGLWVDPGLSPEAAGTFVVVAGIVIVASLAFALLLPRLLRLAARLEPPKDESHR